MIKRLIEWLKKKKFIVPVSPWEFGDLIEAAIVAGMPPYKVHFLLIKLWVGHFAETLQLKHERSWEDKLKELAEALTFEELPEKEVRRFLTEAENEKGSPRKVRFKVLVLEP